MIKDVAGNIFNGYQSFFTSWLYLRLRKSKTISPGVTKLKGEGILDALVISPVIRSTSCRI